MNQLNNPKEKREQARKAKLGSNHPVCIVCGEDSVPCLEQHHIAGQAYADDLSTVCRNCHRKLSDDQLDHPKPISKPPTTPECIGHMLLGLADFFALLIERLREFGRYLIQSAQPQVGV